MADYIVDKLDESIIIKLAEPYEKVQQVVGYVDEVIGEDTFNKFEKYFRWSQDDENYSDWILFRSQIHFWTQFFKGLRFFLSTLIDN
jgi:hypothetical protein